MSEFKVVFDYQDQDGYVAYDTTSKKVRVVFADESIRQLVEDYLRTEHKINVAQTLIDFKEMIINPCESLENFKIALTRMWGKTGVLVQWSKPI